MRMQLFTHEKKRDHLNDTAHSTHHLLNKMYAYDPE